MSVSDTIPQAVEEKVAESSSAMSVTGKDTSSAMRVSNATLQVAESSSPMSVTDFVSKILPGIIEEDKRIVTEIEEKLTQGLVDVHERVRGHIENVACAVQDQGMVLGGNWEAKVRQIISILKSQEPMIVKCFVERNIKLAPDHPGLARERAETQAEELIRRRRPMIHRAERRIAVHPIIHRAKYNFTLKHTELLLDWEARRKLAQLVLVDTIKTYQRERRLASIDMFISENPGSYKAGFRNDTHLHVRDLYVKEFNKIIFDASNITPKDSLEKIGQDIEKIDIFSELRIFESLSRGKI